MARNWEDWQSRASERADWKAQFQSRIAQWKSGAVIHPKALTLAELSRLDPEQISDARLREIRLAEIDAGVDGHWFSQQLRLADALAAAFLGPEAVPFRERAEPLYRELLEAADGIEVRTKVATSLGGVLCDLGRYGDAIELLRPLIDNPGADSNTLHNLGVALMNSGIEGRREAPQFLRATGSYPRATETHIAFFDPQGY